MPKVCATWEVVLDLVGGKYAVDNKVWGAVNPSEGQTVIQRDLDRLEQWCQMILMSLNKSKCEILHLGRGNPH